MEALRRLLTGIQQLDKPIQSQQTPLLQTASDEPNNPNTDTKSLLSTYLTQAGEKLAELDKLIDKNFKEGPERRLKGPRSSRIAWLSSEGRVKTLRNDIHTINANIATCLTMTAMTAHFRLQNCLEEKTSGTSESNLKSTPIGKLIFYMIFNWRRSIPLETKIKGKTLWAVRLDHFLLNWVALYLKMRITAEAIVPVTVIRELDFNHLEFLVILSAHSTLPTPVDIHICLATSDHAKGDCKSY